MSLRWVPLWAALATALAVRASAQAPPDEKKAIGTQMPDVTFIADNDSTFRLSAMWGKPVIVSPIFTSCPSACPMITESLRDALRDVGEPGVGYNVLTVSFDPADDPAAMRAYREQMGLPKGWRLATLSAADLATFLDAIDFHVTALEEGGFAHPNVIAVLGPDLKVASYVHGVMFESAELNAAMEAAARKASLVTRFRPVLLAVSATGALAVLCVLYVTRRRRQEA